MNSKFQKTKERLDQWHKLFVPVAIISHLVAFVSLIAMINVPKNIIDIIYPIVVMGLIFSAICASIYLFYAVKLQKLQKQLINSLTFEYQKVDIFFDDSNEFLANLKSDDIINRFAKKGKGNNIMVKVVFKGSNGTISEKEIELEKKQFYLQGVESEE